MNNSKYCCDSRSLLTTAEMANFRIVPGSTIVIRELRMAFLSELVNHRRVKLFTRDKYTPFVNAVKKTSLNIGLDCFCTN